MQEKMFEPPSKPFFSKLSLLKSFPPPPTFYRALFGVFPLAQSVKEWLRDKNQLLLSIPLLSIPHKIF